jgi:very-short-patch-repair endonuclease
VALLDLIEGVRAGVQSHLEILGVRALLAEGTLPAPQLQFRVLLPDGPVVLDAAWPDVRLAVEFDGAAFHESPEDRERDLRRDVALAALGWVVLRFSYADVTERPRKCAAQVAAVYQGRLDAAEPDIPAIRMSGSAASIGGGHSAGTPLRQR